ncbi:MAG: hypothetical protein K2M30_00415 [Desulfovibrionaceae bacterium]|nr:hypothetical protein [Desulfovibrionaceae bacterium]
MRLLCAKASTLAMQTRTGISALPIPFKSSGKPILPESSGLRNWFYQRDFTRKCMAVNNLCKEYNTSDSPDRKDLIERKVTMLTAQLTAGMQKVYPGSRLTPYVLDSLKSASWDREIPFQEGARSRLQLSRINSEISQNQRLVKSILTQAVRRDKTGGFSSEFHAQLDKVCMWKAGTGISTASSSPTDSRRVHCISALSAPNSVLNPLYASSDSASICSSSSSFSDVSNDDSDWTSSQSIIIPISPQDYTPTRMTEYSYNLQASSSTESLSSLSSEARVQSQRTITRCEPKTKLSRQPKYVNQQSRASLLLAMENNSLTQTQRIVRHHENSTSRTTSPQGRFTPGVSVITANGQETYV